MRVSFHQFAAYLLLSVIAITLCLTTAADAKSKGDYKLEKFKSLAAKSKDGIAKLNTINFAELLGTEGRSYWTVALFTAMGKQYGCQPCRMMAEPIKSISKYWKKNGDADHVFFATVDIDDNKEVFQRLQMDNVPRLVVFPADTGKFKSGQKFPNEINLMSLNLNAEAIAKQLSKEIGVEIGVHVPVDYTKYLFYIGGVIGSFFVGYVLYRSATSGGFIKKILGMLSIAFILIMSSGFMWCKINPSPYIGNDGGEPKLFASGNQLQYGVESHIISALYALLAVSVVGLTVQVPKIANAERRTFMLFVWMIVLVFTYSYLNVAFRDKFDSYPYRLLLP